MKVSHYNNIALFVDGSLIEPPEVRGQLCGALRSS
jgi:hypothetical protein